MKLHEYQAKQILERYGIPVPKGGVAFSADEAAEAFRKLGAPAAMVKAQVLTGGRGKAGGIQQAKSADEARQIAAALIGRSLQTYQSGKKGSVVRAVLVTERREFVKELYMGLVVNRSAGAVNLIFSDAGGVEIEEVARTSPAKIQKIALPASGEATAALFEKELKLPQDLESRRSEIAGIALKLSKVFLECDCQLVEVNPLALTPQGLAAVDAKIVFDDNALFRHPDFEALRDPEEDDPKEKRAKKSGLSYISLEGNIGCLVNGAGLAMATMDVIKAAGGEPANFLDVGGGATKERVLEGFRIILEDKNVKAVYVNIFGGITRCDVIAEALVAAAGEMGIQVPLVVRLEGTSVEEGREILKKSALKPHSVQTMEEGARKVVELAGGRVNGLKDDPSATRKPANPQTR